MAGYRVWRTKTPPSRTKNDFPASYGSHIVYVELRWSTTFQTAPEQRRSVDEADVRKAFRKEQGDQSRACVCLCGTEGFRPGVVLVQAFSAWLCCQGHRRELVDAVKRLRNC